MKKIAYIALAALALAACQKEVGNQAPELKTRTVIISAGIEGLTKTAYDEEGKFSWVEGDQIGVLVSNGETTKQVTFTTTESGAKAWFKGEVEEGYELTGVATYPFTGKSVGYGRNDFAWDAEKGGFRIWGSIVPSLETPLSSTPLFGQADSNGDFSFKTASGIVKFPVKNVPEETAFAFMEVPQESAAVLNGWFNVTDGVIAMNDAIDGYKDRYNWNVPIDKNTDMDYYFFLPVGTLPAGTVFSLCNSSWESIKDFTFVKDVEVVRNAVVEFAPIEFDPVPESTWVSLGIGQFIDSFVWADAGFTAGEPVEVEFFEDSADPGQYRIANPYVAAAAKYNYTSPATNPTKADDFLYFSIGDKGRAVYKWCNMGIALSKKATDDWAMISGDVVASYGSDYCHIVSVTADGAPAQIQFAPCYRTSTEYRTGAPSTYDNEIGKNHADEVVELAFPGSTLLPLYSISGITSVSANQSGDGTGAAGITDNNLTTYWHTPWSSIDTNADPVYGQYVQIALEQGVSTAAFNYCTRNTTSQNGSPALVVVGGSVNGTDFTVIGTYELDAMKAVTANTWVGLPEFDATGYHYLRFGIAKNYRGDDLRIIATAADEKWVNLSELKLFGINTGDFPVEPYVRGEEIPLTSNMIYACDVCSHDGAGVPALVDNNASTYWHSNWYYAVTNNDPLYGIFFDITLKNEIDVAQFKYQVRSGSNGAKPTKIVIGASADGSSWQEVTTLATDEMLSSAAGAWVELPEVNLGGNFKYVRFGIADSNNTDPGSLTGDLNFSGYKKCVNLAELKLFLGQEPAASTGSALPDYAAVEFTW